MANKEIPELTVAGTLDGTELVHVVQGGNSRQTTTAKISAAPNDGVLDTDFAIKNAGGFKRTFDLSAQTADWEVIFPDGDVSIPAGSGASIDDVQDWDNVSVALAALTAGSVGSLVFARRTTGTAAVPYGSTIAGTSLTPAGAGTVDSTTLSGTWRCLGYVGSGVSSANSGTLYVRIS